MYQCPVPQGRPRGVAKATHKGKPEKQILKRLPTLMQNGIKINSEINKPFGRQRARASFSNLPDKFTKCVSVLEYDCLLLWLPCCVNVGLHRRLRKPSGAKGSTLDVQGLSHDDTTLNSEGALEPQKSI